MPPPRFDWHRDAPPFAEPRLRFDPHFQNDGLPVPPDRRILAAVSGGGDSIALLHLLADWRARSPFDLTVATVDHGLRDGSAKDALFVADTCRTIGLPHTILRWQRGVTDARSSNAARLARYALLHAHARENGATCIALGHTLDDQAETVTMRAARPGGMGSGTNGLAGMALRTGLVIDRKRIDLYRPLLHITRQRLRAYLTENSQPWREDPTNDDLCYERVRTRRALEACHEPDIAQRAHFASLCGRSRSWLSASIAACLKAQASASGETVCLVHMPETPPVILANALAGIARRMGDNAYAIPVAKMEPLLRAVRQRKPENYAVGRCLLRFDGTNITVEREHRKDATAQPAPLRYVSSFDAPVERALDAIFAHIAPNAD